MKNTNKTYLSLTLLLFLFSSSIFGASKGVKVFIGLSPAGSFEASSSKIKGKAIHTGGTFIAKKLSIKVKGMKTGLELRDKHFKEKLEYKTYPKILVLNAVGKNGAGSATIQVKNIKRKIAFKYKKISEKLLKATFFLKLKHFKFTGLSYMGVGVKKKVKIEAIVPFKTK